MANDYFDSADYTAMTRGTLARAEVVNAALAAVETGFDRLPPLTELTKNTTTYASTAGGPTAYTISLPHAPASYTAGMHVAANINATNTGAATLNVNGLGAVAIKRLDGSDVEAGDLPINAVVEMRHNGTNFRIMGAPLSAVTLATESAAAAALDAAAAAASAVSASGSASTATTQASTASTQATNAAASAVAADASADAAAASAVEAATHPGAAKAWVVFNGTGSLAILDSYNVTSVTDNGNGDYTVNFTVPFSSANYAAFGSAGHGAGAGFLITSIPKGADLTAAAARILVIDVVNTTATDAEYVSAVFFGNQ